MEISSPSLTPTPSDPPPSIPVTQPQREGEPASSEPLDLASADLVMASTTEVDQSKSESQRGQAAIENLGALESASDMEMTPPAQDEPELPVLRNEEVTEGGEGAGRRLEIPDSEAGESDELSPVKPRVGSGAEMKVANGAGIGLGARIAIGGAGHGENGEKGEEEIDVNHTNEGSDVSEKGEDDGQELVIDGAPTSVQVGKASLEKEVFELGERESAVGEALPADEVSLAAENEDEHPTATATLDEKMAIQETITKAQHEEILTTTDKVGGSPSLLVAEDAALQPEEPQSSPVKVVEKEDVVITDLPITEPAQAVKKSSSVCQEACDEGVVVSKALPISIEQPPTESRAIPDSDDDSDITSPTKPQEEVSKDIDMPDALPTTSVSILGKGHGVEEPTSSPQKYSPTSSQPTSSPIKPAMSTNSPPPPPTKPTRSTVLPSKRKSPSHSLPSDAIFSELKAIKLTQLTTRISSLTSQVATTKQKLEEVKGGLKGDPAETVKRHIRLLHEYNDVRDVGQGLLGLIAEQRGCRIGELYQEFGVGLGD